MTDPLGGVAAFGYNGDGRLATMTDPVGTVTRYGYNADGQLVQEDMTDSNGTLLSRKTYTYDASARRLSESVHRMIDGVLTPLTTRYEYDNNGRQVRMTDPLGNVMQTEYDEVRQRRSPDRRPGSAHRAQLRQPRPAGPDDLSGRHEHQHGLRPGREYDQPDRRGRAGHDVRVR